MKMSRGIALSALFAALVIYVVVQPFLTARALQNALVNKDRDALRELVDFPMLRENLKDELPSYTRAISTQDKETTEALAQFVASMASSAMDEVITPSGLIDLASKSNKAGHPQDLTSGYASHSKFLASIYANAGDELIFVLKRQGLKWRVTDIKGALHVLYPAKGSQTSTPTEAITAEIRATDEDNGATSEEFDSMETPVELDNAETPVIDAQLQIAQEEIVLAAKVAQAIQEKDEADRVAGKSFNESRISWSFACGKSVHGISMLGPKKLTGLMYDEKASICSCVQEEVPYNIEMLLESPSRSLVDIGGDALNDQVNAFEACYFRISSIKSQREQVVAIRREQELQELKEQQRSKRMEEGEE